MHAWRRADSSRHLVASLVLVLVGAFVPMLRPAVPAAASSGTPHLTVYPPYADLDQRRVGFFGLDRALTVTNDGDGPATLDGVRASGSVDDFLVAGGTCFDTAGQLVPSLPAGSSCTIDVVFAPVDVGPRRIDAVIDSDGGQPTFGLGGVGTEGYFLASRDGRILNFGDAAPWQGLSGAKLNAPIVGAAATPTGDGVWLLGGDGGIFSFGDAGFFGSTGGMKLNQPILGLASTATGEGYWLVARDGGIFSFGDARFFGSTGSIALNKPIVGMAATPTGNGYWLVASDGGIFAFGDARFFGSTGSIALNKPIVGMAATPTGNGYWLVASDGGIFNFGDATFQGSTGALRLNQPIIGMGATARGDGYWLMAADGGMFSFGAAPYYGSGGGTGLQFAALAPTAPPLDPETIASTSSLRGASARDRSWPTRRTGAA